MENNIMPIRGGYYLLLLSSQMRAELSKLLVSMNNNFLLFRLIICVSEINVFRGDRRFKIVKALSFLTTLAILQKFSFSF